jgi:hypothetical protein
LKSLNFSKNCFVILVATKQFSYATKPFPASAQTSGNTGWLSIRQRKRRAAPASKPETVRMRTLSFVLAFAFVLAGPSIAGLSDNNLPGIGTFAFSGSPAASAPHSILVAAAR